MHVCTKTYIKIPRVPGDLQVDTERNLKVVQSEPLVPSNTRTSRISLNSSKGEFNKYIKYFSSTVDILIIRTNSSLGNNFIKGTIHDRLVRRCGDSHSRHYRTPTAAVVTSGVWPVRSPREITKVSQDTDYYPRRRQSVTTVRVTFTIKVIRITKRRKKRNPLRNSWNYYSHLRFP